MKNPFAFLFGPASPNPFSNVERGPHPHTARPDVTKIVTDAIELNKRASALIHELREELDKRLDYTKQQHAYIIQLQTALSDVLSAMHDFEKGKMLSFERVEAWREAIYPPKMPPKI